MGCNKMANRCVLAIGAALILATAGCEPKRAAAPAPPPPAKKSVIVLLPEPDGKPGAMVVKNPAGAQELNQAYHAVLVERADVAPGQPFPMDQAEVRRLFGSAIDNLPSPEMLFILHFDEDRAVLTAESEAQIPLIVSAIRDRNSTAIGVTGHTDTKGASQYNYELGMSRARSVAQTLEAQGVAASNIFVESHGDSDLLIKTPAGVDEPRNRRVEVIVR